MYVRLRDRVVNVLLVAKIEISAGHLVKPLALKREQIDQKPAYLLHNIKRAEIKPLVEKGLICSGKTRIS